MEKLVIPILLGTGRPDNMSQYVAKYVHSQALVYGFESRLISPEDYATRLTGETTPCSPSWPNIMDGADGLIIVTPEYNHGYPGELKNMIDQAFDEYYRKPVGFVGVSTNVMGGARAIEVLKLVMIYTNAVVLNNSVFFGNIQNLIDEHGNMLDSSYQEQMKSLFDEIEWFANVLRNAKNEY
jgi:NAD(P)H-dependent FMN reductase